MADQWEDAAKQFKPSGNPAPTASAGGNDDWKLWQQNGSAGESGKSSIGDSLSQFGSTVASDLNPMNTVRMVAHPIDTLKGMFGPGAWVTPEEGVKRGAEMPIPEILGHATAVGLGQAIPQWIGKAMRGAAEPLAESALGVKAINRAYDRTPGAAALDETTGVRPGTIGEQARTRLGDINTELENVVGKSNAPVDIGPARNVLERAETTGRAQNQVKTVRQLNPMQEHLSVPQQGFSGNVTPSPAPMVQKPSAVLGPNGEPVMVNAPGIAPPPVISQVQTPEGALNLKRGFGEEFVHNWNPETMRGVRGTAAQTYHELADTLHRAVPESAELDTRASSLIPVAERAESIERGPGMGQRTLHRVAAHTGAGLGAGLGYYLGGLPGAVAGAVIPEALSEPAVQMGAARALNTGSKVMKAPIARGVGQFIPMFNAAQPKEQQ